MKITLEESIFAVAIVDALALAAAIVGALSLTSAHLQFPAEKKPDWETMKVQVPPGTPQPPESVLVPGAMVFVGPDRPVQLGGSFLCNVDYCLSDRPSARRDTDSYNSMSHVGFRLVMDQGEKK